jgi:hypothetical protein
MGKKRKKEKRNFKKSKILVYLFIYIFQPSLHIIVGTNGDILEAGMLPKKYMTFYIFS